MRVELIAFTARGNALAERLAAELTGAGCPAACTRGGLRVEEWAALSLIHISEPTRP